MAALFLLALGLTEKPPALKANNLSLPVEVSVHSALGRGVKGVFWKKEWRWDKVREGVGGIGVTCWSQRLRQITQTWGLIFHDIMQKPYSIIVLFSFFSTIYKRRHFSLSFQKFENTTWMSGLQTREKLWIWHDNPISAADSGLLCQLHMLLYTECVFIGLT